MSYCKDDGACEICDCPQPTECHCAEGMPACDYCLTSDEDCPVCFIDGAPLTREQVTAGGPPAWDTRDKHDRSL